MNGNTHMSHEILNSLIRCKQTKNLNTILRFVTCLGFLAMLPRTRTLRMVFVLK